MNYTLQKLAFDKLVDETLIGTTKVQLYDKLSDAEAKVLYAYLVDKADAYIFLEQFWCNCCDAAGFFYVEAQDAPESESAFKRVSLFTISSFTSQPEYKGRIKLHFDEEGCFFLQGLGYNETRTQPKFTIH